MSSSIPALMFVALLLLLASGLPVTYALGLVAISFSFFLWGPGAVGTIITATWGTMNSFTLIAVPLFVFMALVLQKAAVVEDLYDAVYKWSGPVRGGLGLATIMVGAILGAVSGVVAAGVIGLGLIGLPQMLKYGYNRKLGIGAVMAGGTLGQLIPPSVTMVVYGAVTRVSVGSLFAGGLTCGLFLAFLYALYILIRSYLNKNICPVLPLESRASTKEKISSLRKIFLPGLLIIAVLGSVFSGAATPTEAAGVGAFGAIVFSAVMKRLNWNMIKEACLGTLEINAMVAWIIIGAAAFSSVFSGIGGNAMVLNIATSMPGGPWMVFGASVLFVFFLGMFLEPSAMIMLAAPIVSPVLQKLGFDPLWWGLIFMVLLQVSYLSPPFGFALFYMRGVAPKGVTIEEIYMSSLPYIGMQLIGLLFIILFPGIALWLPRLLN